MFGITPSSIDLKLPLLSKRNQARLHGEMDDCSSSALAASVVNIRDQIAQPAPFGCAWFAQCNHRLENPAARWDVHPTGSFTNRGSAWPLDGGWDWEGGEDRGEQLQPDGKA